MRATTPPVYKPLGHNHKEKSSEDESLEERWTDRKDSSECWHIVI
ncbi:MAG: hypothetical protein ABEK59_01920 [Halobacteria archaeon]